MSRKMTGRRKLADLKVNPLQGQLVRPMPEQALNALAKKFKLAQAIDYPIEILPDGTIIDGHQRAEAARRAGLTEVDVIVRHDLVGNPAGVELRMIETHRTRKHLDTLDQARHIRRTVEIRLGRKIDRPFADGWDEAQIAIATQLDVSKRHAQRLLHVLDTPMPVQVAVSKGRLAIVKAVQVAGLSRAVQAQIADAIDRGEEPRDVVAEHLPCCAGEESHTSAYTRLLRAVDAGCADLDGAVEQLVLPDPDHTQRLGTLERGMDLLRRLVRHERQYMAALAKSHQLLKTNRPKQ